MEALTRSFRPGKLSSSMGREHANDPNHRNTIGSTRSSSLSSSHFQTNKSTNNSNTNLSNLANNNNNANNSNNQFVINESDFNKYSELIDVISSTPEYAIALSKKVDSAEMDHLAKALLNICSFKNSTISLIYGLLKDEFMNNQVNTILRGNSLATKVETAFARQVGQKYLKDLFGDIILRLVTDIGLNLATTLGKVDEEGIKAEVRVEENRQRVLDVSQEFVDRFTADEMVEKMPRALKAIAGFTAQFARKYTPDRVLPFLGGFMLLRFFNPAIITPESLNMLPPGIIPTNQDRQNFIAITRLLQKLSNQVLVVDSEEHAWINPFIERNNQKLSSYLLAIAKDSLTPDDSFSDLLKGDGDLYSSDQQQLNAKNVTFIYNLVFEHGNYLLNELSKYPPIKRGDHDVYLSAEFLKLMLSIDSSPKSTRLDLLSKKTIFLPTRDLMIDNKMIPTRLGQSISVVNHYAYIFGGNYIDGNMITGKDSLLICNLCTSVWQRDGSDDCPSRKYHTSIYHNDHLIIFGGVSNKECLNDMYKYNIITKKWMQVAYNNEAPFPRYGHSMEIFEESLYIFGGYCFDGKKYFYTNSFYRFELKTRSWVKIDAPNAPSLRMHHACVFYKNSIWIFGGRTPEMEPLGDLWRYDIKKNEWKQISCMGSLPSPRWSHSTNICNRKIILFGGCNDGCTFDDAFEFSFDALTWDKLEYTSPFGPKNFQLADHSAAIYNGRLITMFGGSYTINGTLTNHTQELAFDIYYSPNSTLSEDFKKLINNPLMSDSKLIVGETTIYTHKLLLFSRCIELYNMIDNANNVLRLDGLSEKHISLILRFLYSGEIDATILDIKTILVVIPWCFKFDIPELVRILELRLIKKVNERSLLELISIAEKYNLRILELECIKLFKTCSQDFTSIFPFEKCSHRILSIIACQMFPSK